jgi:RNA polymerase sigma-70 factor (ECF subfamily)
LKCYISIAAVSHTVSISVSEIDKCYAESVAAELGLTRSEFSAIVADVMSHSFPGDLARGGSQVLAGLHWDDLLLARACSRGYETAWNQFLSLYRTKLYSAALAITKDDSLARELADSLYADLFGTGVRADGRRISKLESYMGRGSLEGWLRTVLAQSYVNRFRSQRKFVHFDETMERSAMAGTDEPDCEAEQAQVARATDAALAGLSSGERFLLAAYYLDGRTLAEIGRMLALHESTVSRRLEKVTATLRKRIIAKLRTSGISKGEAEKLLELDVRDLAVDVRRNLAQERQARTF